VAPDPGTWRRAAFALFAVSAGTNVPTPLLLIYRDTLDLGPDVLTAVFGSYALGLVPALAVAGPLSDRYGRRAVVLPSIALAGLTSLLLIGAASSLPVLFAGRALQGAVSGAVFSVGSAWVGELSLVAGAGAAGRRAAVAMTAGFSVGPFAAGLLGEYGPLPTTLPYLLHVAVVVAGLVAALPLPETVDLLPSTESAGRGPLVERQDRVVLLTVLAPLAVCVYAFPTVVAAAVPLLVETTAPPVLLTGVLAGLTLGAGAVAAPLQRRLGRWTAVGAVLLGVAGFLAATAGAGTGSPPLLLASSLLLGSGGGLALSSGLSLTARLARPGRRGALSAVFLGCAYLGFGVPYVTALAAEATSVQVPLAVGAGLAALLALRLLVATRRGQTSAADPAPRTGSH
jgi:MFS family permease